MVICHLIMPIGGQEAYQIVTLTHLGVKVAKNLEIICIEVQCHMFTFHLILSWSLTHCAMLHSLNSILFKDAHSVF